MSNVVCTARDYIWPRRLSTAAGFQVMIHSPKTGWGPLCPLPVEKEKGVSHLALASGVDRWTGSWTGSAHSRQA